VGEAKPPEARRAGPVFHRLDWLPEPPFHIVPRRAVLRIPAGNPPVPDQQWLSPAESGGRLYVGRCGKAAQKPVQSVKYRAGTAGASGASPRHPQAAHSEKLKPGVGVFCFNSIADGTNTKARSCKKDSSKKYRPFPARAKARGPAMAQPCPYARAALCSGGFCRDGKPGARRADERVRRNWSCSRSS